MMEYCINFDLHMFAPYFKCCNYDSYNMSLAIQLHYVYFFGSTSFTLTWPSGQVPPDPSYELVVSNPLNTISQIGKTSPNKRWTLQKNIWKQHLVYIYHIVICFHAVVFLKHIFISNFLKRKTFVPSTMLTTSHPVVISDLQFLQWMRPRRKHKQTRYQQLKKNELRWWYYFFSVYALYIYINARKMISQYFFGGVFNHSRNHAIDIFITICVNMWKAITRVENHFGFKHLYILKLF